MERAAQGDSAKSQVFGGLNPAASTGFSIWIGVSANGGQCFSTPKACFAWVVRASDGRVQGADCTAPRDDVEVYSTEAALMALCEAVGCLPPNVGAVLFTDIDFLIPIINLGSDARRARNYRKAGRKLYAYSHLWLRLDADLQARSISLMAGRPREMEPSYYELQRTKACAVRGRVNMGRPYGEWDV